VRRSLRLTVCPVRKGSATVTIPVPTATHRATLAGLQQAAHSGLLCSCTIGHIVQSGNRVAEAEGLLIPASAVI